MPISKKSVQKLLENRIVAAVVISAVAIISVFGPIRWLPDSIAVFERPFALMNASARDALIQRFPQRDYDRHITIVTIDDRTLSDKAPGLGRWQNFKRDYYADVIAQLKADGAEVIGVDVLFSEASDPAGDAKLAQAVRNAGNVVLGFARDADLRSLPEIRQGAAGEGFFDPVISPLNSKVYSVLPASKYGDSVVESFSFAVLREYFDRSSGKSSEPDAVSFDTPSEENKNGWMYLFHKEFDSGEYWKIPYASSRKEDGVFISFLHANTKFTQISFADVYAAAKTGQYGDYRPELVKGKIVLIGSTATALHDEFMTPVGVIPGVNVHANAINTILKKAFIVEASGTKEMAVLILFAPLFALWILTFNKGGQVIVSLATIVLALAFHIAVFSTLKLHFNYPIELSAVLFAVAVLGAAYKHFLEERGKRLFHMALKDYVAEDIVKLVMQDFGHEKLKGKRREVTLFFSDIAGFTTISENMTPESLVDFLSVYLKEASDIIMDKRGFINKYEGDAIMAIWGAFQDEEDPTQAHLACESAILQQEEIKRLNVRFKEEFGFEIGVRMGINKGPAVVGNIGSVGRKVEFTALGDTVNTASRFEGINKLYGTLICVGEGVRERAKDAYIFRRLDSIMVKGKDKPTPIFELVGRMGEVPGEKLAVILEFEKALNLYVAGYPKAAREIFERLVKEHGDPPSETFVERCSKLEKNGVPDDWTGVYRATEK